ncbi:SPOR domain-containing protein [Bradyrhizobium sediminis]|uniref:SPOR domain-containing protein n=1 Tax=Bradyrhizobium sediminis TaxID=2840469 RepID=A0A975RKR1_9BRAD|nr:SPOR domain-containing protein [Bradyrhizobium sediminis]QWG10903.1 SPOR domain-containing protein [Bradyrhizobium sediminis]
MADRYQDRPFPAGDDYDRSADPHAQPPRAESDPLAELARLIGQTDPFAMGRANQPVQPRGVERAQYQPPAPAGDEPPAGPPPWMRRATPQPAPVPTPAPAPQEDYAEDYPSTVHPLHRYAAQPAAPEPDYHQAPSYAEADYQPDPSRYDDALYGQPDPGAQQSQHDPAYADDAYGYQDGYDDGLEEEPVRKRGGGMVTVAVVLALAVVGTGAAFAYRTYVGSPRSGEPPIIKADNSPTKIVPAPSDGTAKVPDRMATGDGAEKIVPREEAPVDVNRSGPRVVFPPLNPNSSPPPVASVTPTGPPPAGTGNGTLSSSEPRKIKTLAVRGDQADAAAVPVNAPPPAKPAAAPKAAATAPPATRNPPSSANASANAPLSLTPQGGPSAPGPGTRVAATNPVQTAPSGGGGYMVQVASQKNEADAQASYRALQSKYSSVLGSRSPVIRRADLGDKGVYYRAMIGPFGSADEASHFCGNLKTAGGQCVVQRN